MKATDILNSPCGHLNDHITDQPEKKKSKYGNKKIDFDGKTFDSKRECARYIHLRTLLKAGVISDLQCQVPFDLGVCVYKADFTYLQDGKQITEDVKGFKTQTYILKKKLMLERYGIEIQEIK